MIDISPWISEIVKNGKKTYRDSTHAQAGVNGPYKIIETPMRVTSHWLESFASMYIITKDKSYIPIIRNFADYLKEDVEKSMNGAVICMPNNPSHTNGLIGLSWVIDALIKAGEVLKSTVYYEAALKVYNSQNYDFKEHLWDIIDFDGSNAGKDKAFNHNLWFAVSGYRLFLKIGDKNIENHINDYFKHIKKHLYVYRDGLISHFIVRSGQIVTDVKTTLRCFFCELSGKGTPWNKRNQIEYERAYHLFNMYALAQLYLINPELKFFKTNKFRKMKEYALNVDNFISFSDELEYAYYYNSPAYEYPFIAAVFKNKTNERDNVKQLMDRHRYYIEKAKKEKLNLDYFTLNARVYEIMRYYELSVNSN